MLTVAAHLHEGGHTVRMITGSRFSERVSATGAEFVPLCGPADFDDTDLDAAFPGRAEAKGLAKVTFDVSHLFVGAMRSQWAVLSGQLQRRPADVVVYETTFMGVAPLLALPAPRPAVVGCGVIPLTLSSPYVPPFGPGLPYAPGAAARLRNRVLGAVIRRVVMARQQREVQAALADCVPGAHLRGYFMDGVVHVDRFLQFSVTALDYPRPDLPANISYVGPVLPPAAGDAALPDWWAELEQTTRPVVLVTQGTLDTMDLDRLIRPSLQALSDEDVFVVAVTGGPAVERLDPLPANARAATFIPFDLLLPKVSVMVTNGGFGGVHFALSHDIPLVVAGDTEDKSEISARVGWSGAGVDLRTGSPRAEQIRDAVLSVLGPARTGNGRPRSGRTSVDPTPWRASSPRCRHAAPGRLGRERDRRVPGNQWPLDRRAGRTAHRRRPAGSGATGQNKHLTAPRGRRDLVETGCGQQILSLLDADRSATEHARRVLEDRHLERIRRCAGCQWNHHPPVGPQRSVDTREAPLERGSWDEGLGQPDQVIGCFVGHVADRLQPQLHPIRQPQPLELRRREPKHLGKHIDPYAGDAGVVLAHSRGDRGHAHPNV